MEECDRLQGFHLLCDWSDGFGGLASCIAEDLRDEYGNKGILTFLSSPLDTPLDKVTIATVGGVFFFSYYYYCPAVPKVLSAGDEQFAIAESLVSTIISCRPSLPPRPALAESHHTHNCLLFLLHQCEPAVL